MIEQEFRDKICALAQDSKYTDIVKLIDDYVLGINYFKDKNI